MKSIIIRESKSTDEVAFLEAVSYSQELHHPWVKAPATSKEFHEYINRSLQPNQKSYLVLSEANQIGKLSKRLSIILSLLLQNQLQYSLAWH